MSRVWSSVVVLAAALAGPAARAQPAATPPRFPIAVHLVVPPATLAVEHFHDGVRGLVNPSARVPVGAQARDAYAAVMRRTFAADPEKASAALVVHVTSSAVDLDREGWFASVEHELVLREASGLEVARWRVRGRARIAGLGERAIPAAFLGAAKYAAETFAADLETLPAPREWLAAAGVLPSPGSVPPPARPRLEPRPVPTVGPRGAELIFAELGGSAIGADDGLSGGLSARAGWTGRTVLLQVALDLWERPFTAHPRAAWGSGTGDLATLSLGLDAGIQRRLGSRFELHAGAGAAALAGRATARYTALSDPFTLTESSVTAFGLAASLFAGARLNAVLPRTGLRYRVGLEVRRRFGASLDLPDFGRDLAVAELSAGVFFGLELPWTRAEGPRSTTGEPR